MLQCVAVCCSVLQCVAMRRGVETKSSPEELRCSAICCNVLQQSAAGCNIIGDVQANGAHKVMQCVAVCCSVAISQDILAESNMRD